MKKPIRSLLPVAVLELPTDFLLNYLMRVASGRVSRALKCCPNRSSVASLLRISKSPIDRRSNNFTIIVLWKIKTSGEQQFQEFLRSEGKPVLPGTGDGVPSEGEVGASAGSPAGGEITTSVCPETSFPVQTLCTRGIIKDMAVL